MSLPQQRSAVERGKTQRSQCRFADTNPERIPPTKCEFSSGDRPSGRSGIHQPASVLRSTEKCLHRPDVSSTNEGAAKTGLASESTPKRESPVGGNSNGRLN